MFLMKNKENSFTIINLIWRPAFLKATVNVSKMATLKKSVSRPIILLDEYSAILLTFIKLPFAIKIFVLSIFEWALKTGFTVHAGWSIVYIEGRGATIYQYTGKPQFTLNKYCITIHFWLYQYTRLRYMSSSQFSPLICKKISIIGFEIARN